MWNICLWRLELKAVLLHLFAIFLHVFRINQFATLNYIGFYQGFYMFQPAQWAELSNWEITPVECFLWYIAVQKSGLLFFPLFLLAFSPNRLCWKNLPCGGLTLSSLYPYSPRTNLDSPSAQRSPFTPFFLCELELRRLWEFTQILSYGIPSFSERLQQQKHNALQKKQGV